MFLECCVLSLISPAAPLPPLSALFLQCDLDWYYCPRDPGCVTYTMSVESVTFDDAAAGPLAAKDQVRLLVNGTTSLSEVPHYGTFVIYELSGGEIMQGELRKNNYMTITPVAGEKWSKFALDIPFTLAAGAFQTPYFEIGLDIFQGSQGDNEGMCIEVANPPYVKYEQDKPSPPGKPFVQVCFCVTRVPLSLSLSRPLTPLLTSPLSSRVFTSPPCFSSARTWVTVFSRTRRFRRSFTRPRASSRRTGRHGRERERERDTHTFSQVEFRKSTVCTSDGRPYIFSVPALAR